MLLTDASLSIITLIILKWIIQIIQRRRIYVWMVLIHKCYSFVFHSSSFSPLSTFANFTFAVQNNILIIYEHQYTRTHNTRVQFMFQSSNVLFIPSIQLMCMQFDANKTSKQFLSAKYSMLKSNHLAFGCKII